ncbi:MAG: hypothetical protein IJV05_05600 [Muribaculaceae bacterium]|nr:hypothetical protein [Muribaculaceae bacterium]
MRRFYISMMCIISVAISAWSQNLVLEQEEADNEIAVVGYFCKNDSMTFRQAHQKYKINEGDTTISADYEEEFLIVVTDSTSEGYKMKYVPLSFTLNDADTVTAIMTNAMSQLMQSVECHFTTDELGQLQRIDNWREIRDQLRKSIKVVCDSLYGTIPELDSITPRKSLENILLLQFSTEQGIRDSYEELNDLFGLHGSIFDIGDKELDSEENGYPQHILARIGYTPVEDEENDFDGDYAIVTQTTTLIPVEDALDYGLGTMSMMMSDMITDSLDAVRDMIVDTIKAAVPQGIEMKVTEYYGYFLNGWPKGSYYERSIDMGIGKNVETRSIEWTSRHWNIYIRDDESTGNKEI